MSTHSFTFIVHFLIVFINIQAVLYTGEYCIVTDAAYRSSLQMK